MKMKFVPVDVVCIREKANKHSLTEDDVYIEKHYIAKTCVMAIIPPSDQYRIPMSKSYLITAGAQLYTVHELEDLVELFEQAED